MSRECYLYQTRRIISRALAVPAAAAARARPPRVEDELDAVPEPEPVAGVKHEPEGGAARGRQEPAEDARRAGVDQALPEPLDLRSLAAESRHRPEIARGVANDKCTQFGL